MVRPSLLRGIAKQGGGERSGWESSLHTLPRTEGSCGFAAFQTAPRSSARLMPKEACVSAPPNILSQAMAAFPSTIQGGPPLGLSSHDSTRQQGGRSLKQFALRCEFDGNIYNLKWPAYPTGSLTGVKCGKLRHAQSLIYRGQIDEKGTAR